MERKVFTEDIKALLRANNFECCDTHTFWEKEIGDIFLEVYILNKDTIHIRRNTSKDYHVLEVGNFTNSEAERYLKKWTIDLNTWI